MGAKRRAPSLAHEFRKDFLAVSLPQAQLDSDSLREQYLISMMMFSPSIGFLRALSTCFRVLVNLRAGALCVPSAHESLACHSRRMNKLMSVEEFCSLVPWLMGYLGILRV